MECLMDCSMECSTDCLMGCLMDYPMECLMDCSMGCSMGCSMDHLMNCIGAVGAVRQNPSHQDDWIHLLGQFGHQCHEPCGQAGGCVRRVANTCGMPHGQCIVAWWHGAMVILWHGARLLDACRMLHSMLFCEMPAVSSMSACPTSCIVMYMDRCAEMSHPADRRHGDAEHHMSMHISMRMSMHVADKRHGNTEQPRRRAPHRFVHRRDQEKGRADRHRLREAQRRACGADIRELRDEGGPQGRAQAGCCVCAPYWKVRCIFLAAVR